MPAYDAANEIHRQNSMGYLARVYGVRPDKVSFVGVTTPSSVPVRVICENHRAGFYDASGEPVLFIPTPPIIEIAKEFVHTDMRHNRRTHLFAGQCLECGRVYMAESKYGIILTGQA